MRIIGSGAVSVIAFVLAACGGAGTGARSGLDEAWDRVNDPRRLADEYVVELARLPLSGRTTVKPWTDTYWPSNKGGIAHRWNVWDGDASFGYALAGRDAVRRMSEGQLRQLSPAEKYDILTGRYDYPTVRGERARTRPEQPSWYGLCHGWAAASLAFTEPKPVTLTNADGVAVPFGSSDVKALLTFAQQQGRTSADNRMLGARCRIDLTANPDGGLRPECRDTNAGSFHIVVANLLGMRDQPFLADLTRDSQVWNHPLYGFSSRIVRESTSVYSTAAPGTVRIATVETTLEYINEYGPQWDAAGWEDEAPQVGRKRYRYTLELDARGAIIGGEWEQQGRPDFLWMQKPKELTGAWAELGRLYQAALR